MLKHAKLFIGTTFGLQNFKKISFKNCHSKMYYNYISTIHPYKFKNNKHDENSNVVRGVVHTLGQVYRQHSG